MPVSQLTSPLNNPPLCSLQSTYIRNAVLHGLRKSKSEAAKLVSASFVYEYPTIERMATFLSKAVADPNSAQGVDLATRGRELQAVVDKHTEGFPSRPAVNVSAHTSSHGNVYLLSGTTGGLGSNMLAHLLREPAVGRIYAFNRPSKSSSSEERQFSAFKQRGLDTSLLSSEKIVYVEGDLSVSGFALDEKLYEEVREVFSAASRAHTTSISRSKTQSHTSSIMVRQCLFFWTNLTESIIAWKINLNLSLVSFDDSIRGVRALVDFAITSPLARPPHFVFVSSVSVFISACLLSRRQCFLLITYPDFENNGSAAEEMLINPETSVGTGYSESKWVAERILDAAAERTALQPAVVRFGQVCGDGNGTWNETEWFPSLVKSALALGCLPSLDGVSWGY